MKCSKCGNELRNDMFCENCKEYLFNMDKPKKGDTAKSFLKVFGITIGGFILLMAIIFGILEISDRHAYNEKMNAQYEEVYQEFLDGDYYVALDDIEKNKDNANSTLAKKYNELYGKIDDKLYEEVIFETEYNKILSHCYYYIQTLPDGNHISDVKKIPNEIAPKAIEEAKQKIADGEYSDAEIILDNIINISAISDNYINDAKTIRENMPKYLGYYCSKDEIASLMGFTDDELEELVNKYLSDKDYIDYGWYGSITESDGYGNFIFTYQPRSSSTHEGDISQLIVGYELLGGENGKTNMIDIHEIHNYSYVSDNEQITRAKQVIKSRCNWGVSKLYN